MPGPYETEPTPPRNGWFVTLLLTLFALFVGVVGAAFVWMLTTSGASDLDVLLRWEAQSCRILRSEVAESTKQYQPKIEYEYLVGGKSYSSTAIRKGGNTSGVAELSYAKALAIAEQFSPKSEHNCFVSPVDPTQSALLAPWPWYLLILPLPLPFALVPFFGLYLAFAHRKGSENAGLSISESSETEVMSPKLRRLGWFGLAALGLAFIAVGFALGTSEYLEPKRLIEESEGWLQTKNCRVVSSRLLVIPGEDSDTYKPDILYEYLVSGKAYRSDRFNFRDNRIGGRRQVKSLIAAYSEGAGCLAFYDPKDPRQAVLNRHSVLSTTSWLFPMLFFLVGLVLLLVGLPRVIVLPESEGGEVSTLYTVPQGPDRRDSSRFPSGAVPVDISFGAGRIQRLLGFFVVLALATFWNAMISVFVVEIFGSGLHWSSLFLGIFMLPFAGVGLLLIATAFQAFFGIFSPLLKIRVTATGLNPGSTMEIAWNVHGSPNATRLLLTLEGQEEATYGRGTDTKIEKSLFSVTPIVQLFEAELSVGRGQTKISLPAEMLPSFHAKNNKLAWYIRASLEVPRRPDVKEERQLLIRPV